MTIPRFALVFGHLVPSEDGLWVRYDDHERAMLERERIGAAKAVFTREVSRKAVYPPSETGEPKRGGIWK